jgi:hypothetical protein
MAPLSIVSHEDAGARCQSPSIHKIRYRFVRRLFREVDGQRGNRTLDAIGVENRDYHHLSHFEIGGAKRISQHLSGNEQKSRLVRQPRLQSKIILKVVQAAYEQPLTYFPLRDRTNLSPEAETNTTRGSIQL